MEQPIITPEAVPISANVLVQDELAHEELSSAPAQDSGYWPALLMAAALTSTVVGIIWDISWHESIGRDSFWTPAHMAIYLGGVLGGGVGGWLALKHTFFPSPGDRDASVSVFGARAPLGAWVAMWGALAMITSAPFDDWWHNAYGLDVRIVSPPHSVLGLGMFGISVGAILLVLSRQNRLQECAPTRGTGLYIYTGGVFVVLGSVFLLEFIFTNEQHTARFFAVCAIMFPARLVALSRAGRVSWPATRVCAVYMALYCAVDWIIGLFPATPMLAPIFNPVTQMVSLPFPLLLIVPALGIDLLLRMDNRMSGVWRSLGMSAALGGVFLALFMVAQWYFAEFLLTPHARNWFFMSDRIWSYSVRVSEWQYRFWHNTPGDRGYDPVTVITTLGTWLIATGSCGVGLFFGRWMRTVRR